MFVANLYLISSNLKPVYILRKSNLKGEIQSYVCPVLVTIQRDKNGGQCAGYLTDLKLKLFTIGSNQSKYKSTSTTR